MHNSIIRTALVGLGNIGIRHLEIISANKEFKLVAACDTDKKKLKRVDNSVRRYTDIQNLLSNESLDLVVIATPNGLHFSQGLLALEHDSNVLIEKPICLETKEVKQLIQESKKRDKAVLTVLQNRYSPPAQWLNEILFKKVLGEIRFIQVNCFWNRDERYYFEGNNPHPWRGTAELDGGVLFTQFSHYVDLLYWLFGKIELLSADRYKLKNDNLKLDDSGSFSFSVGSNARGQFNYSTAVHDKNLTSEITILGEKGTVKISGQYMEKVEVCDIEGYEMPELQPTAQPNQYNGFTGSAANHKKVYDNVAEVLLREGTMVSTPAEALECINIIEQAISWQDENVLQLK